MRAAGQIVPFRFPHTDLAEGKFGPALLLGKLPGPYDDWLICMVSSQTRHLIEGFDELVQTGDPGFDQSHPRVISVVRVGRFAVVDGGTLVGATSLSSARGDRSLPVTRDVRCIHHHNATIRTMTHSHAFCTP